MADLLGDEFLKFFVCSRNKWNPYSDEVKEIPPLYWFIQFHIANLEMKLDWEGLFKPAAELTGQIANPSVYKAYYDVIKRDSRQKDNIKKQKFDDSGYYESSTKHGTTESTYAAAETNSHYDPVRGLVDDKGNVIMSKEKYDEIIGMDGVMVSY